MKNTVQMKNTPKRKKRKNTVHRLVFFYKKTKMEIFTFCVIAFEPIKIQTCLAPQNNCLNLSFVKDIKVVGKTWLEMVIKWTFVKGQIISECPYEIIV